MFSDWEKSEEDKNIEDTINMIMQSSEKPYTPINKTPNGAQKFDMTHQGEYEAREQQSKNKIQRVHQHNAAYPKMYDELDKRRSIMEISTNKTNKKRNFHRDCAACAKLIKLQNLKSQNVKRSCNRGSKLKSKRTVKRCGTHKRTPSRRHSSRRRCTHNRHQRVRSSANREVSLVNRGCQCMSILSYIYVTNKRNGTSDDFLPEIDPERIENARKPKKNISGTFYSDLALGNEPIDRDH